MKVTDKIEITNEDNMELMKRYPDKYFDLAIVDPPYGIKASGMTMGSGNHKFKKNKNWDDGIPSSEYFKELFRVSKNQIIWGGNYFTEFLPPTPHWLVWDKKNPNLSFAEGELAWVGNGDNLRIFQKYSARVEEGGKIHPTQKFVDLYKWQIKRYSKEGDKILDTHLGSGSIAIACHELKRELVACELDSEYYNNAISRIENRIGTNITFESDDNQFNIFDQGA